MLFLGIVGIGNGTHPGPVLGLPLMSTGRTLREFPVILKEVLQEVVAPLGWSGSPRAFQPAGDGMCTVAVAEGVLPAEALLLDIGAFGFSANILGRDPRAMGFTEGVSAGYQRNRFHVIHRHAGEGLADIARRRNRVRTSIGTFG